MQFLTVSNAKLKYETLLTVCVPLKKSTPLNLGVKTEGVFCKVVMLILYQPEMGIVYRNVAAVQPPAVSRITVSKGKGLLSTVALLPALLTNKLGGNFTFVDT